MKKIIIYFLLLPPGILVFIKFCYRYMLIHPHRNQHDICTCKILLCYYMSRFDDKVCFPNIHSYLKSSSVTLKILKDSNSKTGFRYCNFVL